jgi:hypothetical protein
MRADRQRRSAEGTTHHRASGSRPGRAGVATGLEQVPWSGKPAIGNGQENTKARTKAMMTRASEIISTYRTTPSLVPCLALVGDLMGGSVMLSTGYAVEGSFTYPIQ